MIYEERSYMFQPAHFQPFLALFEKEGLDIMTSHLGGLVGYFTTEIGQLNTAVHIWAYSNFEDRLARREAMWKDPRWITYSEKVVPWIVTMESRLLRPTRFSPLQ
ncbi:NIPSNAP family protein [Pollutimonas bauzanensis]|uniref:NIPSNAP family protein n=1 Tax=Pollutimonas bauzanensis TaxID=658167 RepID=UPI003341BBFE